MLKSLREHPTTISAQIVIDNMNNCFINVFDWQISKIDFNCNSNGNDNYVEYFYLYFIRRIANYIIIIFFYLYLLCHRR